MKIIVNFFLRHMKKSWAIIFSCIHFKCSRFHYRPIILALMFLIILLLCVSVYVQRQISIISRNLMFKETTGVSYISFNISSNDLVKIPSLNELKVKWVQNKIERMSKKMKKYLINKVADVKELPLPNYRVHVFYYAWFRTLKEDGSWQHWKKELKSRNKNLVEEKNFSPDDIYSNFYPYLGCYSSRNLSVVDYHMKMIRKAGIGVVVISWVPPSFTDSPKDIIQVLMDVALKYELKVAFQIYAYESRTQKSIIDQIKYLVMKVGNHPSLFLLRKNNKLMPVFYIYESYKASNLLWKEILSENGNITIRKSKFDGTFFGHLTEQNHSMDIKQASFDGLYTYSSGNGLTYGSSWKNWNSLSKFCKENKLIFVPSVGPGFSDISAMKNSRHRLNGNYYEVGWRSALSTKPRFITITSFNNWQDGSQIEPARPKKSHTRTYLDYEPEGPHFYINLTRWWIKQFLSQS